MRPCILLLVTLLPATSGLAVEEVVADIESVDLDVAAGVEIIESDRERHGGKPDAQAVDDLRAVRREVPGRVSAVRIQADRTAACTGGS